jgi:nitrogen fixation NifU-like protein
VDERDVAFEEIVGRKKAGALPNDLLEVEVLRLTGKFGDAEEEQVGQNAAGILDVVAIQFLADDGFDGELLAQLALECGTRGFAGLDFASRKFPLERMPGAALALANEDEAVAFDHGGCHLNFRKRHLRHLGIIGTHVYSARLLEHFRDPRNVGQLDAPAVVVDATNPACGDILRLSARFEDGRVAEARYQTRGCTASIAAGSALTEWMTGKSREEVAALTPAIIEGLLDGLQPASKHAAVLCVDAAKKLLGVKYP